MYDRFGSPEVTTYRPEDLNDPNQPSPKPISFETKDSGVRAEFSNGGVRDSQEGKARFDLLLPLNVPYKCQLLTRVAELMARGAVKYADRNWEQFSDQEALDRAKASAFRHMVQWQAGEVDEDHAAAVVFNLMAAEYVKGVLAGWWPAVTKTEAPTVEEFVNGIIDRAGGVG